VEYSYRTQSAQIRPNLLWSCIVQYIQSHFWPGVAFWGGIVLLLFSTLSNEALLLLYAPFSPVARDATLRVHFFRLVESRLRELPDSARSFSPSTFKFKSASGAIRYPGFLSLRDLHYFLFQSLSKKRQPGNSFFGHFHYIYHYLPVFGTKGTCN
jgi:hypothetical protein